jgi:protein disulfide-isomerase
MKQWLRIIIIGIIIPIYACSQEKLKSFPKTNKNEMNSSKMKIEIWSDIMCPFCYIGKRHLEEALKQFQDSGVIEIEWRSYQLDPGIPKEVKSKTVYEYLAERKGISLEQSKAMHQNVIEMAKEAGLQYNFEIAKVANSFEAHRIIQLAKTQNLGDEAEERFFKAYFMEGKNLSDTLTLIELAKEIGLNETRVQGVLKGSEFANEVNQDVSLANQIGVQGVPFFVFNRKYAVSGAQPVSTFLNVLQKSFKEWKSK